VVRSQAAGEITGVEKREREARVADLLKKPPRCTGSGGGSLFRGANRLGYFLILITLTLLERHLGQVRSSSGS